MRWALIVTCVVLGFVREAGAGIPVGGEGTTHKGMTPSVEKDARLVDVGPKYAIWRVSQLHPETAMMRAATYTHRFYRQALDREEADWVFEIADTGVGFMGASREDGAMLMESRDEFYFVSARGAVNREHLEFLSCLAVYPDGLLAYDRELWVPKQFYPVYFVPFDGAHQYRSPYSRR